MTTTISRLDVELRYLDAVPESLFASTFALSVGSLEERARCVASWRESLLAGRLPSAEVASWQSEALVRGALAELAELGLPRFCTNQPQLTDGVLLGVFEAWAHGAAIMQERRRAGLSEIRAVLDELARSRNRAQAAKVERRRALEAQRQLRLRMDVEAAALGERAVRACLQAGWSERVAVFYELEAAFGPLGTLLGLGWDLTRAVVQSTGWREVERLRRLLAGLPELAEIVRTLGRAQLSDDASTPPVVEKVLAMMRRSGDERRDVRLPNVPHDVRGVERSGELARMLPSEAALLTHPTLRMLWHVRRAERALLGYRVEGVMTERSRGDTEAPTLQEAGRPPSVRGPLIVCLDTSGSMAGTPEHVAKALVLEAARIAHAEKRACFVYAFSGPGDVVEHDLRLDEHGLASLLELLQLSFHGGTEVVGPVQRALRRLEGANWQRADLLIVTDGEFPCDANLEREVAAAREAHGARVHGLLIGSSSSVALAGLCEPLHQIADWEAFCGGQ